MAQQCESLSEKHIVFIAEQKIFFVGTATADSRVNVSPKGMNSLYSYESDRDQLRNWATKQGEAGIAKYWHEKNQLSIDGTQTGIVEKNN